MNQQNVIVLVLALVAAGPGLAALLVMRRRGSTERDEFKVQAKLIQQMQEQIDSQQQTIRFLHGRVDELEMSRAREFAETESLRQEVGELRQEVVEWQHGVTILTDQLQVAKIPPAWSPPVRSSKRGSTKRDDSSKGVVALRQRIVDQFNLEEIGDLAFLLEIEADDLAGTTKRAKAKSLVDYMEDRGRLQELEELVRSQRPGGEM